MNIQSRLSNFAFLLGIGVLFFSCSGNNQKQEIKKDEPAMVTLAAASKTQDNIIHISGQIQSKESAIISTRVMGFVTGIRVKPGDKVQKGQLLITISNNDIVAKKAQTQALVTEAEAALKDAQKDYERFAELHRQNSASEKEFENAVLHLNSINAKVDAARHMQSETEAMLAYTNLTAPFDGVITQKNIDVGSMATPGAPLLMMEQAGSFEVAASISEVDIANVKKNIDALILIKSSGRKIHGKVSEVSPSAQFSGGQYNIKIAIPENENEGLFSGLYANVSLQSLKTDLKNNATLVPVSAIVKKDQLTGLYTVSENQTALLRWVRLGKTTGDMVEVLSGLVETEKYILTSDRKLYNGAPVVVR